MCGNSFCLPFVGGFLALVLALASAADATPIVFEDPILIPDSVADDAVVGTGLVTPQGFEDPEAWDFWLLVGNAGDVVTVTVNRIDEDLDPVFAIFDGIEFDTSEYTDLFSDSTNTTLLANGDDELPALGPFGDAQATVSFETPEIYVIAVADFGSAPNPVSPELRYQISVNRVPEPVGAGLAAIAMLGFAARRRV